MLVIKKIILECIMDYLDDIVKENYNKFSNVNYELEKELKVEKFNNAYILPANQECNHYNTLWGTGGVLDDNKNYIEISAQFAHNMANRLYGKYDFNEEDVLISDEKVIYFNHFNPHWGHYLIDIIGRLWYFLDKDIQDYKIAYSCKKGENYPIKGNYLELLNLIGINESQLIMVNEVTKFKEVIIPESSIFPGKYYTKEYKKIFDKIVDNCNVTFSKDNKIYCSRSQFKVANRKEVGEEKIEKVFNDNGYQSVYFEKMGVKEQIDIINSAKEIVCVSGTLPHNILFARNNPKLIILNKTYLLNMHQFLVNQVINIDVTFVDIHISIKPVLYGLGPFIMTITDNFKNYCKDNNLKCVESVNYNIGIKTKIWYYMRYLISYRGKSIESEIDVKILKKVYQQKVNENK